VAPKRFDKLLAASNGVVVIELRLLSLFGVSHHRLGFEAKQTTCEAACMSKTHALDRGMLYLEDEAFTPPLAVAARI
jgi:hypothetical protein